MARGVNERAGQVGCEAQGVDGEAAGAPPPDPRSASKGPRPQTPDGLSGRGLYGVADRRWAWRPVQADRPAPNAARPAPSTRPASLYWVADRRWAWRPVLAGRPAPNAARPAPSTRPATGLRPPGPRLKPSDHPALNSPPPVHPAPASGRQATRPRSRNHTPPGPGLRPPGHPPAQPQPHPTRPRPQAARPPARAARHHTPSHSTPPLTPQPHPAAPSEPPVTRAR